VWESVIVPHGAQKVEQVQSAFGSEQTLETLSGVVRACGIQRVLLDTHVCLHDSAQPERLVQGVMTVTAAEQYLALHPCAAPNHGL
jgi:hypothetical protein